MARLARLVPGAAGRFGTEQVDEYERAAREVFRTAVIAGSSEPLVPAVRAPGPPRKAASRPAGAREKGPDEQDEQASVDTAPGITHEIATGGGVERAAAAVRVDAATAAERAATSTTAAATASAQLPPNAVPAARPPAADEGHAVSPPARTVGPAPGTTRTTPPAPAHRREPGDTAPGRLLRAPETVDVVADDFFDGLVRQVDSDR